MYNGVKGCDMMERRKKGTGQVTYVEGRKSPWRATIMDRYGKTKTRFFKTEKEARGFLREINSDATKLKTLMETGVTFNAFSQVFLEEKSKGNMKVRSYETLASSVERACQYVGREKLSAIDSDMVQQMVYDLADKGYSESIMIKPKQAVFGVLKLATAKHFLDSVPVLDITIPRAKGQDESKKVKNNWLHDNEMALYEAECRRTYVPKTYTKYAGQEMMVHPAGYKMLFVMHTGLRLGEALELNWSDYDEYSKTIAVDRNVVYADGKKITQDTKTDAGDRIIILNRQAVADLQALRKQFDEQTQIIKDKKEEELKQAALRFTGPELKSAKKRIQEKYAEYERNHKYICGSTNFPFGSGSHAGTEQTQRKLCKAIGLDRIVTVHGLRHTYVTHYYLHHKNDKDFDLATFSKTIGHASVRTTMEIYTHLDMTENRYIAREIADLKEF